MADALVLGAGLIGSSVGLALGQAGWDVVIADDNPQVVGAAVRGGAGRPWDADEHARVVLVAVPPRAIATVLTDLQRHNIARTYTHVASVQSQVQREVEKLSPASSAVLGGHPLAGRERSGPEAAAANLFVGRPWALCPGADTAPQAVQDVTELVEAVGADPVVLSSGAHDAAVAVLSHLPQVVASALAASMAQTPAVTADERQLRLAGPGVLDTTRLAASDADLWMQILELNAREVAPAVTSLAERLTGVGAALTTLGASASPPEQARAVAVLRELLRAGNAGRALLPVKRGARAEAFAPLRVVVPDEPGRLAALLTDAGACDVNVEDVHVEHVPGRPTGIIELLVHVADVARLGSALQAGGWTVLTAT